MSAREQEVMERLGAAYRAVQRLGPACGALGDVTALALTADCISILRRLYEHLEARQKRAREEEDGGGREHHHTHSP